MNDTLEDTGQYPLRRASDAGENSIKVEIRHMAENISHMRTAVDNMATELSKIAVHEEKLVNIGQAQERAFSAIGRWENELESHKSENNKRHQIVERFMWVASGVGSALTLVWALGGWYIIDSFRDQALINSEMRMHLHDAKQGWVK